MKRLTNQQLIDRANHIHKNKYDYSKTVYKNKRSKIKIICPIHGLFNKTAGSHIYDKQGCPKCSLEKKFSGLLRNNKLKSQKTKNNFIKKTKKNIIINIIIQKLIIKQQMKK